MFRCGVERKLIKEFTGHTSDAVDAYAVTSDEQHERISKILTGGDVEKAKENEQKVGQIEVKVNENSAGGVIGCECNKQHIKLNETEKLGSMINEFVKACKGAKTKIKIEIEFGD